MLRRHTEDIQFKINDTLTNGFLTTEKIIKKSSKIINCDNSPKYYVMNEGILIQIGKSVRLDHTLKKTGISNFKN